MFINGKRHSKGDHNIAASMHELLVHVLDKMRMLEHNFWHPGACLKALLLLHVCLCRITLM